MARIRTVKPELFKHEDLYDLEATTGLPIRVAFIGLFTCCDREGRFKWRPRTLKLDVLPHDTVDFSRVLDALGTRGFIRKYEVDGEEYGVIPTFSKHQVINNRESESDIPEPDENSYLSMTSTREARVDDAKGTRTQGKGKEGKGREEEGERKEDGRTGVLNIVELVADGLSEDVAKDFIAHRRKMKAPITDRAWKGFKREVALAGWSLDDAAIKCIERVWRSFEAAWVAPKGKGQVGRLDQQAYREQENAKAEALLFGEMGTNENSWELME